MEGESKMKRKAMHYKYNVGFGNGTYFKHDRRWELKNEQSFRARNRPGSHAASPQASFPGNGAVLGKMKPRFQNVSPDSSDQRQAFVRSLRLIPVAGQGCRFATKKRGRVASPYQEPQL